MGVFVGIIAIWILSGIRGSSARGEHFAQFTTVDNGHPGVFTTNKYIVTEMTYLNFRYDLMLKNETELVRNVTRTMSGSFAKTHLTEAFRNRIIKKINSTAARRREATELLTRIDRRQKRGIGFVSVSLIMLFVTSTSALIASERNRRNLASLNQDMSELRKMLYSAADDLLGHDGVHLFAEKSFNNNHYNNRLVELVFALHEIALAYEREADQIDRIVQSALLKRINSRALPKGKRLLAWNRIQSEARKQNYLVGLDSSTDLLETEVDAFYDYEDNRITYVMKIPIYKQEGLMKLYRFWPVPLQLFGTYVIIDPKEKYLALRTSSGEIRYQVLDENTMASCVQTPDIAYCYQNAVQKKYPYVDHCLTAIWHLKTKRMQELCPYKDADMEMAIQISDTWFIHYTPHEQTSVITCANGTTYHNKYQGSRRMGIDGNCTFHSEGIRLTGYEEISTTILGKETLGKINVTLLEEDVSKTLEKMGVARDDISRKLGAEFLKAATSMHDIQQIGKYEALKGAILDKSSGVIEWMKSHIGSMGTTAVLVAVVIVGVCCCSKFLLCYVRRRRRNGRIRPMRMQEIQSNIVDSVDALRNYAGRSIRSHT